MTATTAAVLSIKDAALATGIPSRTIRSWIESGRLAAMPSATGRLVDLAAVRVVAVGAKHPASFVWPSAGNAAEDDGNAAKPWQHEGGNTAADATGLVATLNNALSLMDRVTRENVELAGRVGWLQSENHRLGEEVRLLAAPMSPRGESSAQAVPDFSQPPVETAQDTTLPVLSPGRPSQEAQRHNLWDHLRLWILRPI